MTYEVELKFPLNDPESIRRQLGELEAERGETVWQRDVYFAHPQRDFAETDEALRIRTVDAQNSITYKGPLIDANTKTRREIEIPFAEGTEAAGEFRQMLSVLGFREIRTVEKRRLTYHFAWEGRPVELAFDEVQDLGTFLEMEITADEADCDAARASIWRLAEFLQLKNSQRRSYLTLLLQQDRQSP